MFSFTNGVSSYKSLSQHSVTSCSGDLEDIEEVLWTLRKTGAWGRQYSPLSTGAFLDVT